MIRIHDLHVFYQTDRGRVHAVRGIDLDIAQGQFFTLLGPSGCGKTTTLRSIAGLERPKSGEISVSSVVVYSGSKRIFVPANRRGFGMVFQSYAIWPHMDVSRNVAFPLLVGRKKYSKSEIQQKVMRGLGIVAIENQARI